MARTYYPLKRNDVDIAWPIKGQWRAVRSPHPEKKRYAIFCCPGCEMRYAVGHLSHKIGATGEVVPSVVCDAPGCGFHEYIKLEGWIPQ